MWRETWEQREDVTYDVRTEEVAGAADAGEEIRCLPHALLSAINICTRRVSRWRRTHRLIIIIQIDDENQCGNGVENREPLSPGGEAMSGTHEGIGPDVADFDGQLIQGRGLEFAAQNVTVRGAVVNGAHMKHAIEHFE